MKPHQLMRGDNPHHWITRKHELMASGQYCFVAGYRFRDWAYYDTTERQARCLGRWHKAMRTVNIERLRHRGNRNTYGFFDRYC